MTAFDPIAAVAAAAADFDPFEVPAAPGDPVPVLPVPEDAPAMNWRHPKYGPPSATWAYRDGEGRLLGYDARWDFHGPRGPDKIVMTVTWCGAAGWRPKGFLMPRPLYGLEQLASDPKKPVLVVEGCKTADAGASLFHLYSSVSWPGGCKADDRADWSPLIGRDVLVWPDNDPEGISAGQRIAARLVELGAASVAIVDLAGLAIEKGWDAADAVAEGWTGEKAAAFVFERAKLLSEAPPSDGWGSPDMSVLALNRRPPPPFPAEMFGSLWPLLLDLADGTGAPVDYIAAGILASAASLIGGKRRIVPFATSTWAEPCVLWFGCVGDPSANKSPALGVFTGAIAALESGKAKDYAAIAQAYEAERTRAAAENDTWMQAVKAAVKEGKPTPAKPASANEPPRPPRPRLMVMDATPESVWDALEGNPQGLLNAHDEVAGWLGNFERYSGDARAFWLQSWTGAQWTVDRKGRAAGPLILPFTGVSVLGGIQPDKLASVMLSGDDDGMAARFAYFWPDKVPFRRPRQLADKGRLDRLLRRLAGLAWAADQHGGPVAMRLPLDAAGADMFERWKQETSATDEAGTLYKGWEGKAGALVLRVALTIEHLLWADGDLPDPPRVVSVATLASVIDFVEDYAKPMALRVFGDAALRPVDRNAATLARYIRKNGLATINARVVRRGPPKLPGLGEVPALNEAIALLVDADWLRPAPSREGGSPGRQSSNFDVNPAALVTGGGHGSVE